MRLSKKLIIMRKTDLKKMLAVEFAENNSNINYMNDKDTLAIRKKAIERNRIAWLKDKRQISFEEWLYIEFLSRCN